MTASNVQRMPCANCGAIILPSTAKKHDGWCALCRRQEKWAKEDAVRKAEQKKAPPAPMPEILQEYPSINYEQWDSSDNLVEEIELAPDGHGLSMGFAGWWQNKFRQK